MLNTNTITQIKKSWDVNQFENIHEPIVIFVSDPEKLELGLPRAAHLPIKFPGSELRIPNEYLSLKTFLSEIVSFEAGVNPNIDKYYAYLTVDQRFVPRGKSQRIMGAHVDGLPRYGTYPSKLGIDYSYIFSD